MNIEIGKVIGAFGIRGYLKVETFLLKTKSITKMKSIFFEKDNKFLKLSFIREYKGNAIISLKNVNDRNEAESLIGKKLFTKREHFPLLKNNEYYLTDLLGFVVKKTNGAKLGIIKDIKNFGAEDLFEVYAKNKKSFFLPLNKDNIGEIDMKNKIILANPIKGIVIE